MSPKFGVVVFPGSNCDHDAYYSLNNILGYNTELLWHKEKLNSKYDVIILPGGFSYGDYLRAGAIAKFSPIMESVIDFANKGGIVIGICNGFQILLEAGLLPGSLLKNNNLQFICKDIHLKIINKNTLLTNYIAKDTLKIPIAHSEGNYFAEQEVINYLIENNLIIFKYSNDESIVSDKFNPNGSINNIAGIMNLNGNVFGMMPHPERACNTQLFKTDGLFIFQSLFRNLI